ncbi:probable inorganic phosphate transporter 1-12 [Spinacia oleracea]|uniref:Probable inorganic phosphate transporter 1-12 n=1 Tax=Spinacia oleracea TaxID=3562 RepID=A0ABM3R6F1_SPIOL|nr:probable inorganic phosphate transporter 1-12 [Spinacia oleracea]XP_056689859.1 probable inorganic phosphate transporter 1-12 [Spinacia oleracea]XP_056691197.1 probable inorganic phosphate transporter 1-12 [Spinacia oleracea]XP_056692726.1 probable inorganic phosphate transporter 1-12 [Spinacia oleracea]
MAKRQKLKVLSVLDVAKTQWYHLKVFMILGMGFFTNVYELFSISVVTKILGRLYYTEPNPTSPGFIPMNVALCGTFAGQLIFGWLGDKLGRKKTPAQQATQQNQTEQHKVCTKELHNSKPA